MTRQPLEDPIITRIAERVYLARTEARLSQKGLGARAKLPLWKISHIETNKISITVLDLVAIADALGKSLSWFILDENDIEPRSLRTTRRDLPPEALDEILRTIEDIKRRYGGH
jgi:transcriptional regulator with XRE-family HTH domain